MPGLPCPRRRPELLERLERRAEPDARLGQPPRAAQTLAVAEIGARVLERGRRELVQAERRFELVLEVLACSEAATAARGRSQGPGAAGPLGLALETGE